MRKAWAALAVGAIVSMPGPAGAETSALQLEWQAPSGCPDAAYVRGRIDQILRGSPRPTTGVAASGTVETMPDGHFDLALTVRTGDVEESRTIGAASCATLAEAFAVIVALAIDPTRHETATPPSEEERSAAADLPSPPPPPPMDRAPKSGPPPRAPVTPAAPARRFALGLGGALASGTLPDVSAGIVASAVLRIARFRLGALGTLSLRQEPYFDRSAGASFDMIEAGVFGGYLVPLGAVAIGPAMNLEVTHVRVRGFGIRDPQASTTIWPTAAVGGRLEARIATWLGLFARADLLVPFGAPTFTLPTSTGAVQLHDPATVAPRLSLGLEIVLP